MGKNSVHLEKFSDKSLFRIIFGDIGALSLQPRENDLRLSESPIHDPLSIQNYFQSILGSVSYRVVILRTPPYWSVRVASCNFKLGG